MSGISSFIHYHVFRKLCDNRINEQNNLEVVKNIIDDNNVPDIEMGLNQSGLNKSNHSYIVQIFSTLTPVKKGPEYWV